MANLVEDACCPAVTWELLPRLTLPLMKKEDTARAPSANPATANTSPTFFSRPFAAFATGVSLEQGALRPSKTATALCGRLAGSTSRHLRMTRSRAAGTSGFRVAGLLMRHSNRPCERNDAVAEDGRLPVAISYRTGRRAYRSVRWSTGNPRACSGDIYAGLPGRSPGRGGRSDAELMDIFSHKAKPVRVRQCSSACGFLG